MSVGRHLAALGIAALLAVCAVAAKAGGESKHSYTNEDLNHKKPSPTAMPVDEEGVPLPTPVPTVSRETPTPPSEDGHAEERSWRERAADVYSKIHSGRRNVAALEKQLADRQNMAPFRTMIPGIAPPPDADTKRLESELERERELLADFEKELEKLEADAREARIPRGWIEEPEPEVTSGSEGGRPEPTEVPEPVVPPEPTAAPQPTETPEPTETPDPDKPAPQETPLPKV